MLDDLLARFFHQGFDVRAGARLDAGRGLGGGALLRRADRRAGRGGGAARAAAARRRCGSSRRPAPAWKASACARSARSWRRRARRWRAASAQLLLLRLDQALGRVEEAISPRLPVPPLSVERHLAEPIVADGRHRARWSLLLAGDAEGRSRTARRGRARCCSCCCSASTARSAASRSAPRGRCASRASIRRLFHERLAALEERHRRRLRLRPGAAVGAGGGALRDASRPISTGGTPTRGEDIALFADRVGARLGEQAMLRPVAVREPSAGACRRRSCLSPRAAAMPAAEPVARAAARRRNGRSGCFAIPSRSRCRPPRCRRARRCISAGGARSTGSRAPRGRSASRRNGGARSADARDARLFPRRGCRRAAATGSTGRAFTATAQAAAPRWFMHGIFA